MVQYYFVIECAFVKAHMLRIFLSLFNCVSRCAFPFKVYFQLCLSLCIPIQSLFSTVSLAVHSHSKFIFNCVSRCAFPFKVYFQLCLSLCIPIQSLFSTVSLAVHSHSKFIFNCVSRCAFPFKVYSPVSLAVHSPFKVYPPVSLAVHSHSKFIQSCLSLCIPVQRSRRYESMNFISTLFKCLPVALQTRLRKT